MKKKSISHYWDDDVLAWLRKEAKRLDRSVSWVLNQLVRKELSKRN
jgi:hypothetical protein